MKIIDHREGRVTRPGLYRMPAAVYHADPAPKPSLSSSIAKLIVSNSPHHAFAEHPRLGKIAGDEPDATRPKEIGTAAHKLILGQGVDLVVIDADDYRTAYAKTERAAAYADELAPILRPDLEKAELLAEKVRGGVARIDGCDGFAGAPAEVVAIAQDRSGAWLRIMMDRIEIHDTHAIIWDVKTGEQSAAPQGLGRRIEGMGMEVQAALYVRVLEALLPHLAGRIRFRWIFVENEFPHGLTVAEADNVGMTVGARKVDAAIHLWNRCTVSGEWPGYPAQIVRVDFPEWAANRWSAREEIDPQLAGVAYDIATSPHRPLDWESAA
ncbi:PD-(D/E)XK nuclease-like domain-containing protein [Methylobacterium sp. E-041]|uniref:PD-(D/E)XK nuclease family protein n=1 Tax=Methylobacterium sp. E-041 TaxID=2836573 RepID=UPI001FB88470|nr:PD-(D/E)XK nuclease family protein [Methylobacterium sp. E-041]MCJ2107899.1 PD-(D/E)XK nuclease-like domain-containing protein [Methylobacterium sp. E-041]